jgi:hypothetical protein
MAREETLRRVDLARRNMEPWAVLVAEIPTSGLTAEEARDLLCGAGAALRRLMSRSTPSPAGEDAPAGP